MSIVWQLLPKGDWVWVQNLGSIWSQNKTLCTRTSPCIRTRTSPLSKDFVTHQWAQLLYYVTNRLMGRRAIMWAWIYGCQLKQICSRFWFRLSDKFIIKLKSQIHFELLNLEICYLYVPFFYYNKIVWVWQSSFEIKTWFNEIAFSKL